MELIELYHEFIKYMVFYTLLIFGVSEQGL